MKTLELQELENISAGGWATSFFDGLCAGWGAAQLVSVLAYSNPITGTAATVLNVGCGAYTVGRIYAG